MRFFLLVAVNMWLTMVSDVLAKNVGCHFQQTPVSNGATYGWVAVVSTPILAGFLFAFVFKQIGPSVFAWRSSPFPQRDGIPMMAFALPFALWCGGSQAWGSVSLFQDSRVPFWAVSVSVTVAVAFAALAVVAGVGLVKEGLLVRRLGWVQIEQMEAARLKEESAGR